MTGPPPRRSDHARDRRGAAAASRGRRPLHERREQPPHLCHPNDTFEIARGDAMATTKQRSAARRNIKKAAATAKRGQTLKKLPKRTRTALGKQANKVKRTRRG